MLRPGNSGSDALLTQLNLVYSDLKKSSTPFSNTTTRKRRAASNSFLSTVDGQNIIAPSIKKKRYTWSDDLHKHFMACIFDIGLQHSKPKMLLKLLQPAPEGLSTEHIKSHLQKYRKNCQKTRNLFLEQFQVSRNQYEKNYRGKALNPGHHAYPFSSQGLKQTYNFNERLNTSNSANSAQSNSISHVGSSPDLSNAILVGNQDVLEVTRRLGPGKLFFIPTQNPSPNTTSNPNTPLQSELPIPVSASSLPAPSMSRQNSSKSIYSESDAVARRMEKQLNTQQIIQEQRNKYNHFPLEQQANELNYEFGLNMKTLGDANFDFSAGSDTQAEWHNLIDLNDNLDPKIDNVDQIFRFLDD